ncbi:MAG: SpoIIE family protein phosphatase [Synechococcales cyanobacterium RM1_1_8]|nr:SpoIIE family protein phosphatase [Synechococcales cyanobacterium RM1_1_8]
MANILVIDDDPAIQLVLRRTLTKQGHSVALADNGYEGLKQAQAQKPALIICDWMMPLMDGLEVCHQVKSDPSLSTTFFILLTSKRSLSDRVQGLDSGADDFLAKPIELAELQARVRAALRLQELTQDLQIQKQRLETELSEASDYVQSLLPKPLKHPVAIDSCFIPSRELGGDCYDYAWLGPQHLVVFLLDMSGHGLGAALPSVSILNLLRSRSLNGVDFHQPHQVLTALNRIFQMGNQCDKYFTLWYGIYNLKDRNLRYASAGHPPALLIDSQGGQTQLHRLKTPGFPIGLFPEASFVSHSQKIEPGSKLYIFSDGVYELLRSDGHIWGLDQFENLLQGLHEHDADDIPTILEALRTQNNSPSFNDDISLIQLDLQ